MYCSVSRSNSLVTTGATIIFISPGNGVSTVPWIVSTSAVDVLRSVIAQLPETCALPTPGTGVQVTRPLRRSAT